MPFKRSGSKYWYIRVGGVPKSSGTADKAAAKALEDRENHLLWEQQRMGVKPPRSWQEAVMKHLEESKHLKSLKSIKCNLRWLDKHLGHIDDINKITRDLVHAVMEKRGINVAEPSADNATANRHVAIIQTILNRAERRWEWGIRAPQLRRYLEPKEEQRWLTVEEWRKLESGLPDHLRRTAIFSLSTGLREHKVFDLRWSNVDLEKRSLTTAGTTNKLGISVPLNSTALSVLKECKSLSVVSPDYVFLYGGKPMPRHHATTWRKCFEKAGVEYMKWHGLRHTFITWLANAGVPREVRMRLAGHSTGEHHDRYTHFEIERLRQFSEVIDEVLGQNPLMRSDKTA